MTRKLLIHHEDGWRDRLANLLLDGIPRPLAISQAGGPAMEDEEADELIDEVVADPLFKRALTTMMQLHCRDWLLRTYARLDAASQKNKLQEVEPPDKPAFLREFYFANRPAIFRGLASGWPALKRWTPEYLAGACSGATVEVMSGRDGVPATDQSVADKLCSRVPFAEYVKRVFDGGESNDYYLVSRNRIFDAFETRILLTDVVCPLYNCMANPGESVRMWFGPAGTFTALHQDNINQLLVQVVGRKAIRLYAPYYAAAMAQNMPWHAGQDPELASGGRDAGAAMAERFELRPGDALFLPVGWWHEVRSLDPSITLTFRDFGVENRYV